MLPGKRGGSLEVANITTRLCYSEPQAKNPYGILLTKTLGKARCRIKAHGLNKLRQKFNF